MEMFFDNPDKRTLYSEIFFNLIRAKVFSNRLCWTKTYPPTTFFLKKSWGSTIFGRRHANLGSDSTLHLVAEPRFVTHHNNHPSLWAIFETTASFELIGILPSPEPLSTSSRDLHDSFKGIQTSIQQLSVSFLSQLTARTWFRCLKECFQSLCTCVVSYPYM